ncbi:MAG: hypothetical protein WCP30_06920 [Mycobacteriaceae bacterium]
MKKVIISPQAGFGNRLRVLANMRLIGEYLQREVYHYWVEDDLGSHALHVQHMKSITPDYLFDMDIPRYDGQAPDVCYSEWLPGDFWWEQQSTAQRHLNCAEVKPLVPLEEIGRDPSDVILIETSFALFPPEIGALTDEALRWSLNSTEVDTLQMQGYGALRLNQRWSAVRANLAAHDWGITIRRGNFLAFHPQADKSVDQIYELVRRRCPDGGTKIVFSDDIPYRDVLRYRLSSYGDIAATGLDSLITEFLALSRCRTIIATGGSSFGKEASLFGRTGYVPI